MNKSKTAETRTGAMADWGWSTVRASSIYANSYTYTGRRWDAEVSLYYFRAQYYDPKLGRVVGRDPAGYVDGISVYLAYFVPNATDALGFGTTKTDGERMLAALESVLGQTLSECCPTCDEVCEGRQADTCCQGKCERQAKEIAAHILATWRFNWGRGSN